MRGLPANSRGRPKVRLEDVIHVHVWQSAFDLAADGYVAWSATAPACVQFAFGVTFADLSEDKLADLTRMLGRINTRLDVWEPSGPTPRTSGPNPRA